MRGMLENFRLSAEENARMYTEMLRRGVIREDHTLRFGQGMAFRVTLPCGNKVSLSRVLAFDRHDRSEPFQIALIDPDNEDSTTEYILHNPDVLMEDDEVKIVGNNATDYDAMENELTRINDAFMARRAETKHEENVPLNF